MGEGWYEGSQCVVYLCVVYPCRSMPRSSLPPSLPPSLPRMHALHGLLQQVLGSALMPGFSVAAQLGYMEGLEAQFRGQLLPLLLPDQK